MASNGEPFMDPSEHGPHLSLSGDEGAWKSILPSVFLQTFILHRVVHLPHLAAGKNTMAGRCPLFRDGSTERGNCSRYRSGHDPCGTGKEAKDVHSTTSGEVN